MILKKKLTYLPLNTTASLIIKKIVIMSRIHANGMSKSMRMPRYSSSKTNKHTSTTIKLKMNQCSMSKC